MSRRWRIIEKRLQRIARSKDPEYSGLAAEALLQCQKRVLTVAVLGGFSSGKSTLINQMLGHEVLPTKVLPETACPIYIENSRPGLVVEYKNGYTEQSLSAAKMSEELRLRMKQILGSKNEQNAVLRYRLSVPFASPVWPKNNKAQKKWALLDTPGFNSIFEKHSKRSEDLEQEADIVIYVLSADQPLNQKDLSHIEELSAEDRTCIVLLNKIDKIDESEQSVQEVCDSLLESLSENEKIESFLFYPVSARYARDDEDLCPENRFSEFVSRLASFIETFPYEWIMQDRIDLAISYFPEIESHPESCLPEKTSLAQRLPWLRKIVRGSIFSYALTGLILAGWSFSASTALKYAKQNRITKEAVIHQILGEYTLPAAASLPAFRLLREPEGQRLRALEKRGSRADRLRARAAHLYLQGKAWKAERLIEKLAKRPDARLSDLVSAIGSGIELRLSQWLRLAKAGGAAGLFLAFLYFFGSWQKRHTRFWKAIRYPARFFVFALSTASYGLIYFLLYNEIYIWGGILRLALLPAVAWLLLRTLYSDREDKN